VASLISVIAFLATCCQHRRRSWGVRGSGPPKIWPWGGPAMGGPPKILTAKHKRYNIWCPKCSKTHLRASTTSKIFPGVIPPDPRLKGATSNAAGRGASNAGGGKGEGRGIIGPPHFSKQIAAFVHIARRDKTGL
jgi:hypothetical protein